MAITGTNNADYSKYFFSDNALYLTYNDAGSNEVKLKPGHKHAVDADCAPTGEGLVGFT